MSKHITKYIFALLAVLVLFNSCKKEYEKIEEIDDAKIQAFIKQNGISAVKDETGFYYQILDQGAGEPMLNKDSVFYTMTIKSLTGSVYYTTAANTYERGYLGYVAPDSYRIALNAINRGGKVRVIVPSYLAYGKNGNDIVPSNEVIVGELTVASEKTQWEIEDRLIREFLTAKNLTGFIKHPSRVYQNISVVGNGTIINSSSTLTLKYKGRLLDGTQFDESGTNDLVNAIYDLRPGLRKSLVGISKGTKLRIFVPSDLGYGSVADGPIPANSILDFDIEVVDVVN